MTDQTLFYLRDSSGRPFGVLALNNKDDQIKVGVSLCHRNDDWDRKLGRNMAVGRSTSSKAYTYNPGDTLAKTLENVYFPSKSPLENPRTGQPMAGHWAASFPTLRNVELSGRMEKIFRSALRKVCPTTTEVEPSVVAEPMSIRLG